MIRHVVFFNAKRKQDLQAIHDGLSLLTEIPDCLYLEIGVNNREDPVSDMRPDFIVYGEFESDEQLAAYKKHPNYLRSIEIVRPLRDKRIAADFTSA